MKTTLIIETSTRSQLETMLRFLKEVGIKAWVAYEQDADDTPISMASEQSLGEAWLSEEDKQWDELYPDNIKADIVGAIAIILPSFFTFQFVRRIILTPKKIN